MFGVVIMDRTQREMIQDPEHRQFERSGFWTCVLAHLQNDEPGSSLQIVDSD